MMLNQLPLAFKLLETATFNSFFTSVCNQQVLCGLQEFLVPGNKNKYNKENFFYLWGKSGVGKTHLLQATCNYALENNIQAMYISLEQIVNLKYHLSCNTNNTHGINQENPECNLSNYLLGLESIQLLCLDNLECIINDLELQKEVFYLFNKIKSLDNKLIIAANDSPVHIPLILLDLKSRMSWGITYLLSELSEHDKMLALMMRAKQVGLNLPLKVAKFLLSRVSRGTKDLFATLEALDNATLSAKRKLTVPFIKYFLKI